jgi:hypothetical protein
VVVIVAGVEVEVGVGVLDDVWDGVVVPVDVGEGVLLGDAMKPFTVISSTVTLDPAAIVPGYGVTARIKKHKSGL